MSSMIRSLPPQFWRIFPLVLNGLFIVSGIGLIISGALKIKKFEDEEDLLGYAQMGVNANGTISIAIGVLDILVGIAGIVTVLLGNKWLYLAYCGMLLLTVFGAVLTFYGIHINNAEEMLETKSVLRRMMKKLYGNNSLSDGQKLTVMVNDMQSDRSCCGLSGSEDENIFLISPWHRIINVNNTADRVITLPDSCCTVHGDECRTAKDIKKARDDGHVHPVDCIYSLYQVFAGYMTILFIEIGLSTVGQLMSLVYTAVFLKFGPEATASE